MLVKGRKKLIVALHHHNGTGIMMTVEQHQAVHLQMITLQKRSIFKLLQSVAAMIYTFQF